MQHHCIIIMNAWHHYESLAVWIHLSLLQCFMIDGCLSVLKWRLWGKLLWGHSELNLFLLLWQKRKKKTRDVLLCYLCWPAVIAVYLPPSESVGCRSNRRSFKRSFPQESHHSCSLTSRWNQSRLQNAAKSDAAGENPWFLTHLEKYELTPVFFFLSPEIREKQVGK